MTITRRAAIAICSSAWILLGASSALAQTHVRVNVNQSTIWAHDFRSAADVVAAGTTLRVVGQRQDWYEVVLPGHDAESRPPTGFIFKSAVDASTARTASPPRRPAIGFAGFGQFGYTRLAAQKTAQAIFGQPGGAVLGGGAEVRFAGKGFLNASVERFRKTGQRVIVVDREVFRLGIADTVTLLPLKATAGWRSSRERFAPYAGAGVGTILYDERSDFADAAENVSRRFGSYHVLGGIEVRNDWVATAFEVEYSRVPHATGTAGALAAFEETNLGGIIGRIKVIVGR